MEPTLLIADDDLEMVELYQRYLTRCGYQVLTASDGVECLSILRNDIMPTVIVASVDMLWGGADGLLDFLREVSQQRSEPFVILTGCTADEHVAELREAPAVFRYLRKPFLMGRLLDCIHAVESDVGDDSRHQRNSRPRQLAVIDSIAGLHP